MNTALGTFFHPITLTGPTGASETIEVAVDTIILFAVIPAMVLEHLGVEPRDRRRAGGERVAQVRAELNGQDGWAMCVFGPDDEPPRIGRHTLDSFVLDIDEQGRLVPKVFQEIRHF